MDNQTLLIIAAAVAAVSEALSLIPALKSNGILHAIGNIALSILGKK